MSGIEINFDGLVGPTHNYSGLSDGNVASTNNAQQVSNPKQAALQGLDKMLALHQMGVPQAVLAPQERPSVATLRQLGFAGSDAQVLEQAAQKAPTILATCCSASSMWTANAATISPSADSLDGKIHITPANLTNKFHRSIEPPTTSRILKSIFNNPEYFVHHEPLPANDHFGDEGAANHTRLCGDYQSQGLQIFTYGRFGFNSSAPAPVKYAARQTFEASQSIARLHKLRDKHTYYVQQNPEVIDQGVFHNDVIAVGNQNTLFYHEKAFIDGDNICHSITEDFPNIPWYFIKVSSQEITVEDAVSSYLFNSQLVTMKDGSMCLIAPQECQNNQRIRDYLDKLISDYTPISNVEYIDLNQSMKNGGGPACLRLRVALNKVEMAAINQHCIFTEALYTKLKGWVNQYYRDRLTFNDMRDPLLLNETRAALDELTQILHLNSVYPFQKTLESEH